MFRRLCRRRLRTVSPEVFCRVSSAVKCKACCKHGILSRSFFSESPRSPFAIFSICGFTGEDLEVRQRTGASALITSDLHLCFFLPMMWFCRLCQPVTSTVHRLGSAAECETVGMRVSTSESGASVLCQRKMNCSLQGGREPLPPLKDF